MLDFAFLSYICGFTVRCFCLSYFLWLFKLCLVTCVHFLYCSSICCSFVWSSRRFSSRRFFSSLRFFSYIPFSSFLFSSLCSYLLFLFTVSFRVWSFRFCYVRFFHGLFLMFLLFAFIVACYVLAVFEHFLHCTSMLFSFMFFCLIEVYLFASVVRCMFVLSLFRSGFLLFASLRVASFLLFQFLSFPLCSLRCFCLVICLFALLWQAVMLCSFRSCAVSFLLYVMLCSAGFLSALCIFAVCYFRVFPLMFRVVCVMFASCISFELLASCFMILSFLLFTIYD